MAELERIKIDVYDLKVGLFVSALDRPWSQTSFPLQGFQIRSSRELTALKAVCQYVYIDSQKSIFENDEVRRKLTEKNSDDKGNADKVRASVKPLAIDHARYGLKNQIPSARDFQQSSAEIARISNSIQDIYGELRSGSNIDEESLAEASSILTDAVVKMPTASFWSALLQQHDDRIYSHGLRSATWALICGRHIGLETLQLKRMAQGILLKDVYRLSGKFSGKTKSDPVLTSVSMLRESGAHPKIIAVVKYHREKFNGSGKPFGLVGEKIPFLARIAAIATAYDLALHPIKDASKAKSPSQAAKLLYNQKGRAFQEELVVEFIEAIGLYPLGTMVKLSTGETAVVVKHNPERRLKPEVMVIHNAEGEEVESSETIDLSSATSISITDDLPSGSSERDLKEIFENSVLGLASNDSGSSGGFMKRLFGS